jgi:hypothetical protein
VKRAERFILRWKQQSLADAFFQWRINVRVCREESARLNLVVSRMLNRRAYAAFNRWLALVEENTRKRQMLAWTVGRISRPSASAAFEAWRDTVDARKAKAATEHERWLAGVRKAERFMLAWVKRDVSTMFIRWRMHTVECKRQRRIVSRCVARMQHRSLASSMNRWSLATSTLRRERVIVRRALEKLKRREMASAFYEWSDMMSDKRMYVDKVAVAERFLMAFSQRLQFRAFNRWREAARKLRTDGVKVARCIQKMTRNACASAFLDWAELVEAKRKAAREAEQAQVLYEAKVKRAERFILRWKQQSLADAFFQWRINVRVCREESARLNLVVSRMLNRRAYAAFNRWLALVEENTRKRQMLAWTVGRISRPSTSAAFEAWRDMVDARKAKAATDHERWLAGVRKAERFMLAWVKRDVSTMFIRWRMHTVECKRQRRIVSRCVARMQHRSLASSMNRWSLATSTLRRERCDRAPRTRKTEAARDGVCVLRVERHDVGQTHVCRQGGCGGAVPDGVLTALAVPRVQPLARGGSQAAHRRRQGCSVHPEDDPERLRLRVPRLGRARGGEAQGCSRGRAGAGPVRGQGEARRAVHPALETAEPRRRVFPVAHQRSRVPRGERSSEPGGVAHAEPACVRGVQPMAGTGGGEHAQAADAGVDGGAHLASQRLGGV